MLTQSLPNMLRFGSSKDPFRIEFDRRFGSYSMNSNHYHTDHEIYYLFRGERNYFIKDSLYHVQPGDLVLVQSNDLHKTSQQGEPNHDRIVFYYSPQYFEAFKQEEKQLLLAPFMQTNPIIRLNLQERLQIETMLSSLLNEMVEEPPGFSLHVRNTGLELLLFTARSLIKRESQPDSESSPIQHKVTEIVRHINRHYGESLDLETIAKQFYISKSHLSRVFKKITGFGFTEYVNITRVREAERLLRETGWSVTQVAEYCGFESLTHFGKVFKALSGLSPRDYRKLNS